MKIGDRILFPGGSSSDGFNKMPDRLGRIIGFFEDNVKLPSIRLDDGEERFGVHHKWIKIIKQSNHPYTKIFK